MLRNTLLILMLVFISFSSMGGSTGFVFEGKTYYQYKDGVAVNETPINNLDRAPASLEEDKADSMILYFTEDDLVRCYYWDKKDNRRTKSKKKRNSNIHCLKLKDIK